jgi:hypothetical protein
MEGARAAREQMIVGAVDEQWRWGLQRKTIYWPWEIRQRYAEGTR